MKLKKQWSFLLLSGLLIWSCAEKPKSHPENQNSPQVSLSPTPNIVPVIKAGNWYKNYGNNRATFIEGSVNKEYTDLVKPYEATRFVTADYKILKEYIAFIDQESKNAGVVPSGLRFYFGATSKTTTDPGRETIFLNPVTSFKNIRGDISYAIATDSKGNKIAVTVGSVIDSKAPAGKNLIMQRKIQSLAGDDVIWPPPPVQNDPNDYH